MEFNEKLKALRERSGISLAALADKIHCSKGIVGHWETGRNVPTLDKAIRLCKALGVKTTAFDDCDFGGKSGCSRIATTDSMG